MNERPATPQSSYSSFIACREVQIANRIGNNGGHYRILASSG